MSLYVWISEEKVARAITINLHCQLGLALGPFFTEYYQQGGRGLNNLYNFMKLSDDKYIIIIIIIITIIIIMIEVVDVVNVSS